MTHPRQNQLLSVRSGPLSIDCQFVSPYIFGLCAFFFATLHLLLLRLIGVLFEFWPVTDIASRRMEMMIQTTYLLYSALVVTCGRQTQRFPPVGNRAKPEQIPQTCISSIPGCPSGCPKREKKKHLLGWGRDEISIF